jgi:MFS transporter, PPP family, 3-phenylpropionic acid transporter
LATIAIATATHEMIEKGDLRRFAAVYFVSFLAVGVYTSWLPPLLDRRGLSPAMIGVGLALVSFWRVTAPPAWGVLADRIHRQHWLLAAVMLVAGVCLVPLALPLSPTFLLVALGAYGFFAAPSLPLTEALTLSVLGSRRARYGQIRLWGSLGFITMSVGMGWVVARWGLELVPWALALPIVAAGLLCLGLPARTPSPAPTSSSGRGLPWLALVPILLASTLGQASHSPYYAYFTLDLTQRGVAAEAIGSLWAIGVVAEIVLMALAARLFARIGLVSALRWGLALAALRWLVLATTSSVVLVAASQPLHAASYAMVHIASLQLIDELTPPGSRVLAQSVLSAAVNGVGVGGGFLLAGALAGAVGYAGLYGGSACVCVVALAVTLTIRGAPTARPGARGY